MAEAQNIPVGSTTAGQIAVAAESTVATRMSVPPSFASLVTSPSVLRPPVECVRRARSVAVPLSSQA
ncbi:hypothetical protein ACN6LA_007051, partial [Streptomyces sp. SAS_269]|uniref:hypothetical protein n=1 Tax=Streptomyces sp. SAS_269 TaxID=3412749 RepID=UPI00403CEFB8